MKFLSALSLILSRVALLQVVWKKWNIPMFLIASFTLQLFLILVAPLRKRSSNWITRFSLWLSYLAADWVAAQAIGLIIKATEPGCLSVSEAQAYLFSFWAQFLLIHLGGPDTITALALEDNELWLRTALHLGTQAYGTLGVLFRSTRSSGLWAATVMMFVAGIIKYLERVTSLFHGRLMDALDENPRDYAKKLVAKQKDLESQDDRRLTNIEMVRDAFNLFQCHKRLFIDRHLGGGVRRRTREYFKRRSAEEVYKLLEIELNFAYEAIYTKMKVIQKTTWKRLRHIVLFLEVGSLLIWFLVEKRGYPDDYDIRITYALVVGAIAVDVYAFLRMQLSDWNIAHIMDDEKESMPMPRWANWRIKLYNKLLAVRTRSLKEAAVQVEAADSSAAWSWFRRVFFQRWSQSMHQLIYDEIEGLDHVVRRSRCSKLSVLIKWFFVKLICKDDDKMLTKVVARALRVNKKWVSSEMWDFIYEEAVRKLDKSSSVSTVPMRLAYKKNKKRVAKPNGEELVDLDRLVNTAMPPLCLEENYPKRLQEWMELTQDLYNNRARGTEESKEDQTTKLISQRQDISVALMKYLQYLLLLQTDVMYGAVGKEEMLFLMDSMNSRDDPTSKRSESSDDNGNEQDRSQGVKNMNDLEMILDKIDENEREIVKWELVARVSVKLLCIAAIKCRPDVHAKQLKNGGEFISFVWLLMVNLGITQV